ncbi:tyrosine-type recombinase/integrase [bacterium]|nr:tyrosine-type recombinase/integrase [bacterium]
MKSRIFHGFHPEGTLHQCIHDYLQTLNTRGLSKSTFKQRESSFKCFVRWCQDHQIQQLSDLTGAQLENFQSWLIDAPLGKKEILQQPKTIRTRLLDLRLLFRYCVKQNLILENPFSLINVGKLPPYKIPDCLTESEVCAILSYLDIKTTIGIRDRAALETLYSTGIRRQELLNLNLDDVNETQGILKIIKGKGRKDRLVPIGQRALKWIYHYLNESRPLLIRFPTNSLFLNISGNRLGSSSVERVIRNAKQANGIIKWGAAHLFRHSCATHMLKNGADIRVIQEILGHSEIDSTLIYIHLDIKHLKQIHQKTHPAELDYLDGSLL